MQERLETTRFQMQQIFRYSLSQKVIGCTGEKGVPKAPQEVCPIVGEGRGREDAPLVGLPE